MANDNIHLFVYLSNDELVLFFYPKQAKLNATNSPARIDPASLKIRQDLPSKAIVLRWMPTRACLLVAQI
jgi:hypothetical protein